MSVVEPAITLQGVRKRFGDVVAVRDVSLEIAEGEFLTLLGPSGCGKTTTMRIVAGFEDPDAGRVLLRGEDVVGVPPNRREVNMCFQHYALFPHMTVGNNIAYGLKLKKVARAERVRRVEEILELVGLAGYGARKPAQLSGGQQQRVALARALVNRPAALLLDEPLGALDVKLRKQMQLELKRIQHELRTTFVYVTHDQEEALSMSDRIAVMRDGAIEQLGSPREVYERPETPFVADFVGVLNAIAFRVDEASGGDAIMRLGDRDRIVVRTGGEVTKGAEFLVAVRPERVRVVADDAGADGGSRVVGRVEDVVYLGTLTQFHVAIPSGATIVAHRLSDERAAGIERGQAVTIAWDRDDASVLHGP